MPPPDCLCHVPFTVIPMFPIPTVGVMRAEGDALSLGATKKSVRPTTARPPPATKKTVDRFPALVASRNLFAASSLGHTFPEVQFASFFLLIACSPKTAPTPRPTTPTPAVTSPTVRSALDDWAGVSGAGDALDGPGAASGVAIGAAAALVSLPGLTSTVFCSPSLSSTVKVFGSWFEALATIE